MWCQGRSSRATDQPAVTDHARRRWGERAPQTALQLERAWRKSLPVRAPERACESARLYAPADVLLVVSGGAITTVCPANYDSLQTAHLGMCSNCANLDRFGSETTGCRWCGDEPVRVETGSGISITFTGEI